MFPSEIIILLAMVMPGNSEPKITRQMNIMNEYADHLYNSLVVRGFIKKTGLNRYKLTSRGEEELSNFLDKNRGHALDIIEGLQQLGVESINRMKELSIK